MCDDIVPLEGCLMKMPSQQHGTLIIYLFLRSDGVLMLVFLHHVTIVGMIQFPFPALTHTKKLLIGPLFGWFRQKLPKVW